MGQPQAGLWSQGPRWLLSPASVRTCPLGQAPRGSLNLLSLDRWEGRWVTAWEKGPRDHPILSPWPEPPAAALSELRPVGAPATVPAAWLLRPVASQVCKTPVPGGVRGLLA